MDASLGGAGAVIAQMLDDGLHPVAFASWLFNRTQRRYSTTDRELLTLILLTRKYRSFFFARNLKVLTDHQPIPGYLRKDPHGRVARWISELNQFSFKIDYIPGKDNQEADCMSRTWENLDSGTLQEKLDELERIKLEKKIEEVRLKDPTLQTRVSVAVTALKLTQSKLENPNNHFYAEKECVLGIQARAAIPTDEQLASEQGQDEDLKPIIRYLVKGELPDDDNMAAEILKQAEHYALQGMHNVLVKMIKLKQPGQLSTRRVVPKVFWKLICSAYHDTV